MRNEIFDESGNQIYVQDSLSKTFMSNVFSFMFVALTVSGIAAYVFGTTPSLVSMLYNLETGGMSLFGWVVMLAPLGLVIWMNTRINKLSYSSLFLMFFIFATIIGISLSSIFLVYSMGSIATTFFVTAGTFAIMAIIGYTTKTDLTKFGSILFMALIGLIIASVVNWFMASSALHYIISGAGVLIFTGLTAYDTQRLKNLSMQVDIASQEGKKLALMGALSLYLNFINLFLFLLRFLGGRD